MPEVNHPDSNEGRLRDIERRLKSVETAPRAEYTSVQSGKTRYLDENGDAVISIGKLGATQWGILIESVEGRQVFALGRGISAAPPAYVQMYTAQGAIVSTHGTPNPGTVSSTLAELWHGSFFATGPDVFITAVAFPGSGQTMSVSFTIQEEGGGMETTVHSQTGITVSSNVTETFAIPTACLVPGTGVDPLGRFFTLRAYAARTAGSTDTVDLAFRRSPSNANFIGV
jgi:hypothetical protein